MLLYHTSFHRGRIPILSTSGGLEVYINVSLDADAKGNGEGGEQRGLLLLFEYSKSAQFALAFRGFPTKAKYPFGLFRL
jgi:hypothetical protein